MSGPDSLALLLWLPTLLRLRRLGRGRLARFGAATLHVDGAAEVRAFGDGHAR